MSKKLNLQGQKFEHLFVIKEVAKKKNDGHINWLCICDCGNLTFVRSSSLKSGHIKSCGCLIYKHRNSETRLYGIWCAMKGRCHNPNNSGYRWYGNKGIRVYSRWKNNFIVFRDWALANGYLGNLTIDRIDNRGNYEPNNCQWITISENVKKANREKRLCQ